MIEILISLNLDLSFDLLIFSKTMFIGNLWSVTPFDDGLVTDTF
jgi:hypothetical protein